MSTSPADTLAIASRFVAARQSGTTLPDFPGRPPLALAAAYAVQDAAIRRIGAAIGGWKVGRIAAPLAEQFGADRLVGPIFCDSIVIAPDLATAARAELPVGRVFAGGFAAAEAEFLLRIGAAPPATHGPFSLAEAAELIDSVHVGIEIASSPLAAINDLGPAVTVSDFGNNNGLIVGAQIANWREADFDRWDVELSIDGSLAGRGRAAAFIDGTLGSVRFLLNNLAQRGIAIAPGTWVSTGAITGVHPVSVGQVARAQFGGQHEVSCTFAASPALTG